MKQVFFILLVIISFQGFSQSVKIPEIGLEVMTKDLGKMNWEQAKKSCENLGDGWRLPTIYELIKIWRIRESVDPFARPEFNLIRGTIGVFKNDSYWSSMESIEGSAWILDFYDGSAPYGRSILDVTTYVRAVRTLK